VDLLKGNYKLDKNVSVPEKSKAEQDTEKFEREALAQLGGSICFVAKPKKLVWDEEADSGSKGETGK
jgi:hypothetical protein